MEILIIVLVFILIRSKGLLTSHYFNKFFYKLWEYRVLHYILLKHKNLPLIKQTKIIISYLDKDKDKKVIEIKH